MEENTEMVKKARKIKRVKKVGEPAIITDRMLVESVINELKDISSGITVGFLQLKDTHHKELVSYLMGKGVGIRMAVRELRRRFPGKDS